MKNVIGYAYLENLVKEICVDDFPDYEFSTHGTLSRAFNKDTEDEFVIFSKKEDLLKEYILLFTQEKELCEKYVDHRWKVVSYEIKINDLKKELIKILKGNLNEKSMDILWPIR